MKPVHRALLHFPVGLFNVFLLHFSISLGAIFAAGFLAYEILEDWRDFDRSYLDIYGYLWGLGIGGIVWFLLF